jgi:hypothetical protein
MTDHSEPTAQPATADYTPEPWYIGKDYYGGVSIRTKPDGASNIIGEDAIFENTGRGSGDMSEEDARRIVACVNACRAWPTESLEAFANDPNAPSLPNALTQETNQRLKVERQRDAIAQERDAALEVLRLTVAALGRWEEWADKGWPHDVSVRSETEMGRALLRQYDAKESA